MSNSSANTGTSFEAQKLAEAGRISVDLGLVPSQHSRANRLLLNQLSPDFDPYQSKIKQAESIENSKSANFKNYCNQRSSSSAINANASNRRIQISKRLLPQIQSNILYKRYASNKNSDFKTIQPNASDQDSPETKLSNAV